MQFSIRLLLLAMFIFAVLAFVSAREIHRQKRINQAVNKLRTASEQFETFPYDPTIFPAVILSLREIGITESIQALEKFDQNKQQGGFLYEILPFIFEPTSGIPSNHEYEYVFCQGLVFKRYSISHQGLGMYSNFCDVSQDDLRFRAFDFPPTDDLNAACTEAIEYFLAYEAAKGYNRDNTLEEMIYIQAHTAVKHCLPDGFDRSRIKEELQATQYYWDSDKLRYDTNQH